MQKLLITRPLPERVRAAARARFDVTARASDLPLDADELRAALRDYDMILPTLGDLFRADVFADVAQPRAKILANFGVGYNHIDVAAARAAGLAVSNTPGAVTDATADIAMTLILMTARRAGEGERMLRAGRWQGWAPTQMLGQHVSGARVGIIGMGRIGKAIAQRCHFGFGMEVSFYNRSVVEGLAFPATQKSLAEVLDADYVVLAVPGGAETRHLINAETLAQIRPDAILINISRGDVVDEAALVDALQSGGILGAGLDVYEHEPRVSPALIQMENVTLLPHLGTACLKVREAMGMMAVDNLIATLEGRPLPNPV
ncbi:MAG: 2-hydroxyacid dehydrogenase [Microgenomates group bacterium]